MNYWDKLMGDEESAGSYMLSYGEGPGSQTRQTIFSYVQDGETLLDAGCGPGWNYDHTLEYGPNLAHYAGIDYSSHFINAAKRRHPDVDFSIGDIRDLNFLDDSFDVVLLQDCLEHTNGYERPVREALRVAKKRVIVTFWHLTEDDDHINDDGDDGWGAWYSRKEWEKFLNSLEYLWFQQTDPPSRQEHRHEYYHINKELGR